MNREETKELIKVMQHYAAGGDVDFRWKRSDPTRWHEVEEPNWDETSFIYRIALSPEDRLIMDAWEADNNCLECMNHDETWRNRLYPSTPPTFDGENIYRIKPKYTPEQQALIDAHERGESIGWIPIDNYYNQDWKPHTRDKWYFDENEYRLTPAPVVIVTYSANDSTQFTKGYVEHAIKGSELDERLSSNPIMWKNIEERTL